MSGDARSSQLQRRVSLLTPGTRVTVNGQQGVIVSVGRTGMLDIRLDNGYLVRKHQDRVETAMARKNPEREWRLDLRPSDEEQAKLRAEAQAEEERLIALSRYEGQIKRRETAKYGRQDRKARYDKSDIDRQLGRVGAAFFVGNDPPRLSASGQTYCGNPIDGSAYYLLVSNKTSLATAPRFLTKEEVEEAGGDVDAAARAMGAKNATAVSALYYEQIVKDRSKGPKEQVAPEYAWVKHGRNTAQLPPPDAYLEGSVTPDGQPEWGHYFVVYGSKRALQQEILDTFFSPYKLITVGPVPADMKLSSYVAMNSDLALGSDVWRLFLKSGGVSARHGRGRGGRQVVDSWNAPLKKGTHLTLGFTNKAANPFFSWVQTVEPIYEDGRPTPCLDESERLQARALTRTAGQFSGVDRIFARISQLFTHKADDTEAGRLRSVDSTWRYIGKELARLANWRKTMQAKQSISCTRRRSMGWTTH